MDIGNGGTIGYADDVVVWVNGNTTEAVKTKLEEISQRFITYTRNHFLAINLDKTQIMWVNSSESPPVLVGGISVNPAPSLELLGVRFDKSLRSNPFLSAQLAASKRILGISRRLGRHLPPSMTSSVSSALFVGKLSYAAAATISPRFSELDSGNPVAAKIQVAINDAARSILNCSKKKRVARETLLVRSNLPSLNRLTVRSLALETWKAIRVRDGPGGAANPLGGQIGDPGSGSRSTRATTAGLLPPPAGKASESLVWRAYSLWNSCAELREASSLSLAKRAADRLAANAPI